MDAVATSLLIFLYCALVGAGVLAPINDRSGAGRFLTAPALGFGMVMSPAIWLNWAGLPVERFAIPLCVSLALGAAFSVWRRRDAIPFRRLLPFAVVLLFAFVLAGHPMFAFGFDWLSYANDDMANYVLGAERIVRHGFFEIPNRVDIAASRDLSLVYWNFDVVGNIRVGVETLLAVSISVFRHNGFQLFMPTIMAMHLMLLCSAAALVYRTSRYHAQALVLMSALSTAALNTLGTEYQLFAQVCGIGLLCAAIALTCNQQLEQNNDRVAGSIVAGIAICGMLTAYPEATPFLALAVVLYFARAMLIDRASNRQTIHWLGSIGVVVLLLQNVYLRTVLSMLALQTIGGTRSEPTFWYFLVPTGPATLFGLIQLSQDVRVDWISPIIALGLLLLVIAICSILRESLAGEPVALAAAAMLMLSGFLFVHNAGFGLFKLAMFAQPFLFATLTLSVFRMRGLVRP